MKRALLWLTLSVLVLANVTIGDDTVPADPVESAAAKAIQNAYRNVDADAIRLLPIGVFDSGTGGLTVLETILTNDAFDNDSHTSTAKGDGRLDFDKESFIFLADQANMPYGNYPVVGKENLLDDLIVKDAWFLMGRDCFRFAEPDHRLVSQTKSPVKAIVIACNTATAYGKSDIEQVIQEAGVDIQVIGVVDAGAKGAVGLFKDGKPGTIGVVPTKGTALSGAYPAAIRQILRQMELKQRIDIFQQGAFGLAGCIDGVQEYVLLNAQSHAVREDYRGPSMTNRQARIDRQLLPRYGFDCNQNRILYSGSLADPTELQLNSVDNYIAYHLVTLMEQIRGASDAPPLRAIILGCTHFPYYKEEFHRELDRLRNYREEGQYIYRPCMADKIELVDPAFFAARELYESLAAGKRLRARASSNGNRRSEFYLTVPCREKPGLKLDGAGWFTYEQKYGRTAGRVESDFRAVPLDGTSVDPSVLERLQRHVPAVWRVMTESSAR